MNEAASEHHDVSRRSVLRGAGAAGAASAGMGLGVTTTPATAAQHAGRPPAATPPRQGETMIGVPFERRSTVRIAMIGLGNRGAAMLDCIWPYRGSPWSRCAIR